MDEPGKGRNRRADEAVFTLVLTAAARLSKLHKSFCKCINGLHFGLCNILTLTSTHKNGDIYTKRQCLFNPYALETQTQRGKLDKDFVK